MSNFSKIQKFHNAFGLTLKREPYTEMFDDSSLIKLRVDLIDEEIKEYYDAVNDKNIIEVIDALTDILYVVYGAGASFGADLNEEFKKLHNLQEIQNIQEKKLTNFELLKIKYKNINSNKNNIFQDSLIINYYDSLINSKFLKFKKAIIDKNYDDVINSLVRILGVIYCAGISYDIDLDKTFDIVHKSNMSKLCKTKEEAIKTVEWYKINEKRYDTPNYRLSDDENYYVVYNESTGKILKSINYTPANFTSMI